MSWVLCLILGAAQSPPAVSDEAPSGFLALVRSEQFVRPGLFFADERQVPSGSPLAPVLPADFQQHRAIVLVADRLAEAAPETLVQIVAALRGRVQIVGLVADTEARGRVERLFARNGLPAGSLCMVQVPTDSVWIRDFGPVFVEPLRGGLAALDFRYVGASRLLPRKRDDAAGQSIALQLKIPVAGSPLNLEQGNLLSNGRGVLLTTTLTMDANIARGYESKAIVQTLRESLGCRTIVVLERLRGEPTGHVDMFACWSDEHTVILGSYERTADPVNAAVLDRNAKILAALTIDGKPLQVWRCPMPEHDDSTWRTYTNCVFANGLLAVPRYRLADRATDECAIALFRQLLPNWSIVSISSESLVAFQGSLRCITLPVPPTADRDR